ncbi:MAG: hypothetical protein QM778_17870 [Myxococcales bacterium]
MKQANLVWTTWLTGSLVLGACGDNVLGEHACAGGAMACDYVAQARMDTASTGNFVDAAGVRGSIWFEVSNENGPTLDPTLPISWTVDVPCPGGCSNAQLELAPDGQTWLTRFEGSIQKLSLVAADGSIVRTYESQVGTDLGAQLSVDGKLSPYVGPLIKAGRAFFLQVRADGSPVEVPLAEFSPSSKGFFAATSQGHVRALRADQETTTAFEFDAAGKLVWRQDELHDKPALAYSEQDLTALDRGAAQFNDTTAILVPLRGEKGTPEAGDHWGLTALDAGGTVSWNVPFKFVEPRVLMEPRKDGGVILGSQVASQSGALQFLSLGPDGSYHYVWDLSGSVNGNISRDLRMLAMDTDSNGDIYAVLSAYESSFNTWVLCRMSLTASEFTANCALLDVQNFRLNVGSSSITDLVVPQPGVVIAALAYPSDGALDAPATNLSLMRIEVPWVSDTEAWGKPGSSLPVP